MRMDVTFCISFPDLPGSSKGVRESLLRSMHSEMLNMKQDFLDGSVNVRNSSYYDDLRKVYRLINNKQYKFIDKVDPMMINFSNYGKISHNHSVKVDVTVSRTGPMFFDCVDPHDLRYYNHIFCSYKPDSDNFYFDCKHSAPDGVVIGNSKQVIVNINSSYDNINVRDVAGILKKDIDANVFSKHTESEYNRDVSRDDYEIV